MDERKNVHFNVLLYICILDLMEKCTLLYTTNMYILFT